MTVAETPTTTTTTITTESEIASTHNDKKRRKYTWKGQRPTRTARRPTARSELGTIRHGNH